MIKVSTPFTTVRLATPDDTQALMDLCLAAHAESPRYRILRFDPVKVADVIRAMVGTYATGAPE